jgi:hypothetical protein
MKEEEDVGEGHEDHFLEERVAEGVDGAVDEIAAVVEWANADSGRQGMLNLKDALPDALDDLHGVLAGAHDDDAPDDLASIDVEGPSAKVPAEFDGGDIAKPDGSAIAGGDEDFLEILGPMNESQAADNELETVLLDDFAADIAIVATDGIHDFGERNPGGAEARRVDLDLVLLDEATDTGDLGHAGDGDELLSNEEIL